MTAFLKSPLAIVLGIVATLGILAIIGYNYWGWFGGGGTANKPDCKKACENKVCAENEFCYCGNCKSLKSNTSLKQGSSSSLPTTCSGLQDLLNQLQQQYKSACTPTMGGGSGAIIGIPANDTIGCTSIQNKINEVTQKMSGMNCRQYETLRIVPNRTPIRPSNPPPPPPPPRGGLR